MSIQLSGAGGAVAEVDPTSKAQRVALYGPSGEALRLAATFRGTVATFRTLGSAAVPQTIFSAENQSGSGRLVYIRGLCLFTEMTAVLATVACQCDVARAAAMPTGGTVLAKHTADTALASNGNVVFRGATAADGGAATSITASAAAGYLWRNFVPRQATAVGQVGQAYPLALLPTVLHDGDHNVLRENQALVVQITGTGASNAPTNHYLVVCCWDEV